MDALPPIEDTESAPDTTPTEALAAPTQPCAGDTAWPVAAPPGEHIGDHVGDYVGEHLGEPGRLTPGWRNTFVAGWIGVIAALGCFWQACRVGGFAPWWLGPETDLQPFYLVGLPFVAPALAALAGLNNIRYASHAGIVAGVATMALSLGDIGDHPGMALVEVAIGAAGVLISVASLAGRLRRAPSN